jgi:hypothetical protein
VQLREFFIAKWAVAYCKLLPQSKAEWLTLTKVASPPKKCKQSQVPMVSGDSSLKIQQAALHNLLHQLPALLFSCSE